MEIIIKEISIEQCLNKPRNPSCSSQTIETRVINTEVQQKAKSSLKNTHIYKDNLMKIFFKKKNYISKQRNFRC
jgi:hypothetical protein